MDRGSFIKQNFLNNTGKCNHEICECDETELIKQERLKKINSFHLVILTILAFITAAIFSIIKSDVIRTEIDDKKNQNAISCSPNINEEIWNTNHQPADNNNGNSCPHQFGPIGILYLNNSNHRKNHVC
jgi:hypothetical protein